MILNFHFNGMKDQKGYEQQSQIQVVYKVILTIISQLGRKEKNWMYVSHFDAYYKGPD